MMPALVIAAAMAVSTVTVVTDRVICTLAGRSRATVVVVGIVTDRVIRALAGRRAPPLSSFAL